VIEMRRGGAAERPAFTRGYDPLDIIGAPGHVHLRNCARMSSRKRSTRQPATISRRLAIAL